MTNESLEAAGKLLADRVKVLQKIKQRLARGHRDLAKGAKPVATLKKLIADLSALPPEPAGPDLGRLAEELSRYRDAMLAKASRGFQADLRAAAETVGISVRVVGDCFAVGPFGLKVDAIKESAALEYAKVEVSKGLPLDASKIVAGIQKLASELLTPPIDLSVLSAEVEEAIRVVLARQKRSTAVDEWRAELPTVYREMYYLRQGRFSPTAKKSLKEYPLARFVVEIKTLVQSDENLSAARRFRLEPAVIENTKNLSKSVFFPEDLAQGCGEGMYFQAIILFAAP